MNAAADTGNCMDQSRLVVAVFGAIFCTLLLCTGFALAIWYFVIKQIIKEPVIFPSSTVKNAKSDADCNNIEATTPISDGLQLPISIANENNMHLAQIDSFVLEVDEVPKQQNLLPKNEDGLVCAENDEIKKRELPEKNTKMDINGKMANKPYDSNNNSCVNGTPQPRMVERLQAMLSTEQVNILEENRRRLEQESRQLRELGVI